MKKREINMPVYCVFARGIESGEDTLEAIFETYMEALKYVYSEWMRDHPRDCAFREFMKARYLSIEIWECGKPYSGKYLPLKED